MKRIKAYWMVIAILTVIAIGLYIDYGLRQRQKELDKKLIELNKIK